jgi:cytochrome b6-f complex iron-sulfur subunit
MERKDFLKKGMALCGLSVIPVSFLDSCTKVTNGAPTNVNFTLDLTSSSNSSLNSIGGQIVSSGVLVICTATNTWVAFSAACTHQGCQVGYSSASRQIICPCHGGTYNASTGAVLGGPPPSALTKYTVTKSGNILTIKS